MNSHLGFTSRRTFQSTGDFYHRQLARTNEAGETRVPMNEHKQLDKIALSEYCKKKIGFHFPAAVPIFHFDANISLR